MEFGPTWTLKHLIEIKFSTFNMYEIEIVICNAFDVWK